MNKFILTISLIIYILSGSMSILNGQNGVAPFLLDTEWLNLDDQEDWDKLIEQHEDADNLLKESNELFLQASILEQESGVGYEKNQKEAAKLEKKAMSGYHEAIKKHRVVYEGMYKIVITYVSDEDKTDQNYLNMISYAEQASSFYDEVKKIESESDKEMLTKANEIQLASIESGLALFSTPIQSTDNLDSPSDDSDIVFDNELYQQYQKYISDSTIPDPIDAQQLMSLNGDAATFEAFQEIWQQYSSDEPVKEENLVVVDSNIITSDLTSDITHNNTESTNEVGQSNSNSVAIEESLTAAEQNFTEERKETESFIEAVKDVTTTSGYSKPINQSEIEFRVQVAASKLQLSLTQLNSIYTGDYSILENKEGSYYKYQVKGMKKLPDAQTVCANTGVNRAYITAYKNSQSIPLIEAINEYNSLDKKSKSTNQVVVTNSIEFSVQVAASRIRLSQNELDNIYSGSNMLSTVFEEGWYKYQIQAGNDLALSLETLEKCNVKKAFLVAYKNGRKIKLYKAINEYKKYLP